MGQKVCLLFPYYGSFPNYFNLWLLSASKNNLIDFYIISDKCDYTLPNNVHFVMMPLEEIRRRASNILGFESQLFNPYKLCDHKPLYGLIFEDITKEYDWWGYGDLDVIYGNIMHFIERYLRDSGCDIIYGAGHLTIIKNQHLINQSILINKESLFVTFSNTKFHSFDESYKGLNPICQYFNRCGDYQDVIQVTPEYSFFLNQSGVDTVCKRILLWENGNLFDCVLKSGEIIKRETIYVHLQKRSMVNKIQAVSDSFLITPPNYFTNYDYDYFVNSLSNSDVKKHYFEFRYRLSYCKGAIKYKARIIFFVFIKRLLDIFASFIGLVILSPLFLVLMILIVCTSKGGPFFRGERVGRHGKMFRIFKFRSMVKDCEGKGKWNVGDNDERITKIGHFLRKTKLDEIPQLINVLIGQMSLVGYRPELKYYVDMYTEEEKPILDLKPGITDWASMVNMKQFEGFTKADDPDEYYLKCVRPLKLKLQLYYRYNHSFFSDIYCIILTVLKVFTRSDKLPKKIQTIVDEYKKEQKAQ